MYFIRSSHSTLFTIRQAGWGPNVVCINVVPRPGADVYSLIYSNR